jgi:hypothetical protein
VKIIVLYGISIISLFIFFLFFGIEFDREWGEPAPFVKYRPSLKFVYDCPGGEASDNETRRTDKDKEECDTYEEFLREHTTNPLFLIPVFMFFSIAISTSFLGFLMMLNQRIKIRMTLTNYLIFIGANLPLSFILFIGSLYLAMMAYYNLNKGYDGKIFLLVFWSFLLISEVVARLVISKSGIKKLRQIESER